MSNKRQEGELQNIAREISSSLDLAYGIHMGFVLVAFPFGKAGIADYISNGRREDIIKAMRETADRLERQEDIPVTKGEG